jgi:hypothetical protein
MARLSWSRSEVGTISRCGAISILSALCASHLLTAELPDGLPTQPDPGTIAGRLIALLPR